MALSSRQRTGYAICLILTILLVGLHFAGKSTLMQLLVQDMSTTMKTLTLKEYIPELSTIIRIVTSTRLQPSSLLLPL